VRHSATESPWSDHDLHAHALSDEIYLLLQGRLDLVVAGAPVALLPGEMLFVNAGVVHGVVGGVGPIEHFGFRAPALEDRVSHLARTQSDIIATQDPPPAPGGGWGYHIRLADPENRHCWLLGVGSARYRSRHFLFAFLDFPTQAEAAAGIGTRLRMHLHRESWEYYVCLRGSKTLQVEDERVEVHPRQMLVVNPGARHNVIERQAPYVGFTFRVPILDDKVLC
jgi:mannose-6-phosphate isomerase-like protein (cupin superfamily)